jgi:hypothetical protein
MANMSGKLSEVKVSRADARACGRGAWLPFVVRAYNRAVRREGRAMVRAFLSDAAPAQVNPVHGFMLRGSENVKRYSRHSFRTVGANEPCACGASGPGMRCAYCEW